jgi:hypothetical protein
MTGARQRYIIIRPTKRENLVFFKKDSYIRKTIKKVFN